VKRSRDVPEGLAIQHEGVGLMVDRKPWLFLKKNAHLNQARI